jgi:hypothetical protein
MTDYTKYKNITVDDSTYVTVTKLQDHLVPDMKISRSEVNKTISKRESEKTKW